MANAKEHFRPAAVQDSGSARCLPHLFVCVYALPCRSVATMAFKYPVPCCFRSPHRSTQGAGPRAVTPSLLRWGC